METIIEEGAASPISPAFSDFLHLRRPHELVVPGHVPPKTVLESLGFSRDMQRRTRDWFLKGTRLGRAVAMTAAVWEIFRDTGRQMGEARHEIKMRAPAEKLARMQERSARKEERRAKRDAARATLTANAGGKASSATNTASASDTSSANHGSPAHSGSRYASLNRPLPALPKAARPNINKPLPPLPPGAHAPLSMANKPLPGRKPNQKFSCSQGIIPTAASSPNGIDQASSSPHRPSTAHFQPSQPVAEPDLVPRSNMAIPRGHPRSSTARDTADDHTTDAFALRSREILSEGCGPIRVYGSLAQDSH